MPNVCKHIPNTNCNVYLIPCHFSLNIEVPIIRKLSSPVQLQSNSKFSDFEFYAMMSLTSRPLWSHRFNESSNFCRKKGVCREEFGKHDIVHVLRDNTTEISCDVTWQLNSNR